MKRDSTKVSFEMLENLLSFKQRNETIESITIDHDNRMVRFNTIHIDASKPVESRISRSSFSYGDLLSQPEIDELLKVLG